jgi:hypothetical protein
MYVAPPLFFLQVDMRNKEDRQIADSPRTIPAFRVVYRSDTVVSVRN